jgi:hypothetical protein
VRKIPTVFRRDPDDMRRVLPEVMSGCEWVLAGEGVARRKFDGTCVGLDTGGWWARREVKPGKATPDRFMPLSLDEATGKTVGWEPVDQSAFARWFREAFEGDPRYEGIRGGYAHGTYELCGPKINGNPEGFERHTLVLHVDAACLDVPDLSFDGIRKAVLAFGDEGIEGVVWHHPDGRMAKLKARDFR